MDRKVSRKFFKDYGAGKRQQEGDAEVISKLLGKEEVNAALVLALSGTIMVLVANGLGPVSLGRVVSGALSNPVPGGAAGNPSLLFRPGSTSSAGRRVRRNADRGATQAREILSRK